MAIYTCLDMIQDCRENKPAGWSYLIRSYIPVIRIYLTHYYSGRAADTQLIERVLKGLHNPSSGLWSGAATEREFVAQLRQEVLRIVELDKASVVPEVPIDLEVLTDALEPFTATERQFVWFQTMSFDSAATAKLMNLEASTVQASRDRADEALRSKLDRWRRGLIVENGLPLGKLAVDSKTEKCLSAKAYIDMVDGRITWSKKKDYETHMMQCWFCVDHCCRIREADFALRTVKPLSPEDAEPFRVQLKLPAEKKGILQRMFG